jgi:voltage-gated potassium channel
MLLYLVVVVFAIGYFMLARADDGQFDDLDTKTDGLYFTMTTLATVGFGDVHATGQLGRRLVTLQIAFDLVFVGILASMLGGRIRRRAQAARDAADE